MADEEQNFDEELQPYLDDALATLRDPNATALDVSHILFGEKQLAAIASALPGSNIRSLKVGREHADDAALAPLIDALPQSRVTSLEFRGTRMKEKSLERLTNVLPKMSLSELQLDAYYRIDDDSLCKLMAALPPGMRKLGFACQNFSNKDAAALAKTMRIRPLEAVEVSRSILDEEGTAHLMRALPGTRLKKLSLTHAVMSDDNAALLAEALPKVALDELRVWGCKLSAKGAQMLAESLPQSQVQVLDVGSNGGIGEEGTVAIAQALPKSRIRDLRIDQCRSKCEGFKALAAALPRSRLESLGLFSSQVDAESAQALATAIPLSPLKTLSISNNPIGNAGAQALAEALPSSGLERLGLRGCGMGDEAAKALAESLPKSRLAYLSIKENGKIGLEGMQALAKAVAQSQLVRLDIFSHENEKINAEVLTGYRAAHQHFTEIFSLAVKLTTQPDEMTADEWQQAARETAALQFVVQQEWRMGDGTTLKSKEATHLLAGSFLRAYERHPDACQKALLNLLPYNEAKQTLAQLGVALSTADLLDEKGGVPQDRCIFQGGAGALFADAGAWENVQQMKQAYASLPEAQKPLITNLHQLTAAVSASQRQRQMAR